MVNSNSLTFDPYIGILVQLLATHLLEIVLTTSGAFYHTFTNGEDL